MVCLAILFSIVTAKTVVRRSDFEVTIKDDSSTEGIDIAPAAAQPEESKLETGLRISTHCGSGDNAEYECVLDCMEDKKCRNQPEVIKAIQDADVFKTQEIQDGSGYTVGAPCASFYGDNAFSAIGGWASSGSTSSTFCARGEHDAAECKDGVCQAINNDEECKGSMWSDHKKCKIRHKSCGNAQECAAKCMDDKDCRASIIRLGAAELVLNTALKVRCVQEQDGEKRCFFTPGNPCSDSCQDRYDCHAGRCNAVTDVEAKWAEPESKGAFSWMSSNTKPSNIKCKHFWQSCKDGWMKPGDAANTPGCDECMFESNCCIKA